MAGTLSGLGSFSGLGNFKTEILYSIGQTGPGGGIIFYDAGSTLSWGRYMEVATTSTSPAWTDSVMQWSGTTNVLVGTSSTIGTGYTNTLAMVAQNSTADKAGTKCRDFTGGGKTDWFLPSYNELTALYNSAAKTAASVGSVQYFSSTEYSYYQVHTLSFSSGGDGFPSKTNVNNNVYTRAIRYV